MRKFNYHGDLHIMSGEVVGKWVEDGRHFLDLEIRGTNQRGEVTCPGTATVVLPSRVDGAVRLPDPPADFVADARRVMARHLELEREEPH
jgi:hypothetical protein